VNKAGLIEVVSEKLGDRRTASTAVEAVVDAITRAVAKGEKVGISGFGVFERVERAARTARNPTTGEAVRLDRTTVPKFRPGQGFKDIVSGAKEVGPAGVRAVTARAGIPRTPAVAGAPARTPRRAAAATSGAGTTTGKAVRTAPPAPTGRATARTAAAPAAKAAGRTVAAPGAARSAAAAKAPGRSTAVAAKPRGAVPGAATVKARPAAAKAPAKASAKKPAR
jgi:DNA-binding protein HU-beta